MGTNEGVCWIGYCNRPRTSHDLCNKHVQMIRDIWRVTRRSQLWDVNLRRRMRTDFLRTIPPEKLLSELIGADL